MRIQYGRDEIDWSIDHDHESFETVADMEAQRVVADGDPCAHRDRATDEVCGRPRAAHRDPIRVARDAPRQDLRTRLGEVEVVGIGVHALNFVFFDAPIALRRIRYRGVVRFKRDGGVWKIADRSIDRLPGEPEVTWKQAQAVAEELLPEAARFAESPDGVAFRREAEDAVADRARFNAEAKIQEALRVVADQVAVVEQSRRHLARRYAVRGEWPNAIGGEAP
jgi:hypothetical protein